jgi:signal transduction histidine kinase
VPLNPMLRDEVYRIGREALINAFRHAAAHRIEVELSFTSALFRVCVRDDGCGIDPQTLDAGRDGHWGLSGMRERADRIGARLRVGNVAAGGTEVELTIPGAVAYAGRPSAKRDTKGDNRKDLELTERDR